MSFLEQRMVKINKVSALFDENNNIRTEQKGQIGRFSDIKGKDTYRLHTPEPEFSSFSSPGNLTFHHQ